MSIRVVVAIALAVTLAPILPVMPAQIEVLEQIRDRIDLTVFNPDGRCQEPIHLTGNVHLVTDVRQESGVVEITAFMTLEDVHGVGAQSRAQYVALGAVRKDMATPTLPARIPIQATFAFVPLGACRLPGTQQEHLLVSYELMFDEAGGLKAGLFLEGVCEDATPTPCAGR